MNRESTGWKDWHQNQIAGGKSQLHRNLIFIHFFSSHLSGKIMSNNSIYLFHFFLSYFLVAKTEAVLASVFAFSDDPPAFGEKFKNNSKSTY